MGLWLQSTMENVSIILIALCFSLVSAQVRHDHLTSLCNGDIVTSVGGRLEASTELTYENNMNCVFKVTAPESKRLLIQFNWFDIEQKVNNVCVDYLNIYDGNDITSATLNSEPLCGEQKSLGNMTSSGRYVTFQFVTDANAVWRGFDLTYTVFSLAPCETADFGCSNSLCISSTLKCDGYTQCGDGSDETSELCTVVTPESTGALSMGAKVGIGAAALVVLIVIIIVVYKIIDYYRWQKFLRQNGLDGNEWDEDEVYQYPVTKHYHTKISHNSNGAQSSVRSQQVDPDSAAEALHATSTLDSDAHARYQGGSLHPTTSGISSGGSTLPEKKPLDRTKSLMLSDDEDLAKPYSSQV